MRAVVRNSVCALGVSVALIAGVVSVPPPAVRRAEIGHAYVSDMALTASSSPTASSAVDDLEVLRDRIDRALRTGLYIALWPALPAPANRIHYSTSHGG
jgi:hypothetical protein